ncbi:retrovirus-related pol polyprotein from transposon TNT 1-94 [Tanacetum coccineum]|uniref:Retrovirus-related pol polyprotein from transposon TNT 1-94 n=1 Tax=Tanacetum coccineum TaxID=301880 RepID=A0ABQ5EDG1_9ASTR
MATADLHNDLLGIIAPANERASQTSNQTSPVTPFVHKCRPPSQVLASLRNVNAVFPQFEVKDTITSLRIQLDGHKGRKREFEKKLKAQVTGTTSSGPSTSETPKVLAPGMYNLDPSLKPSQKPVDILKKAKLTSLPVKSANARRVEAHHRTLNKKNRVDSNLLVKHSVSVSKLNNVCAACNKSLVFANHNDCLVMCDDSVNVKPHQTKRENTQPKKEWKPIKRVWKSISKPVASSKPQWKPTGRHFSLFEKYPLTRIMEPTDMPIELPPSASSSPKITMVSRQVVQIVLWYLESGCSRHMTYRHSYQLVLEKFIGTSEFGKDEYARSLDMNSFGDEVLEVAFPGHIHLHQFWLLQNLFQQVMVLWASLLNHLNFGTLNELARNNLVRGLPMLKYAKDHLCPSCQLGKSKKASHPLKTENTNTEVLNTLHMDLCGPMRTESINGKKYILVIVDDYTRFAFVRTDNGTGVVNKTLDGNGLRVLVFRSENEPPLFLWAEAVATACYTLNRSLVHTLHGKTYYELLKGKKPNLQYFRVFGSLCYPTNDYDDVGKLKAKADIVLSMAIAKPSFDYRQHIV